MNEKIHHHSIWQHRRGEKIPLTGTLLGLRGCAEVFGQIFDASLGAASRCSSGIDGKEIAISNATTNVKGVLDLIDRVIRARQNGGSTEFCLQSIGDLGAGVGFARAGGDTSG